MFRVRCPTADNSTYTETDDIGYGWGEYWVKRKMEEKCSKMYDKIEVWWASASFSYTQNGLGFFIRYVGKNEPVGQAYIVSSPNSPLGGDNLTFYSNVTIPYGVNLFYDVVPFEMLRTYETEPQVLVTVGDFPAVCHNLTCNYNYTVPVGEVTAYTYTALTKTLVLTGTSLP